jgi:tight adherence protein B
MPLRVNEYIFFHLVLTLVAGGLAVLLADSFMLTAIVVLVAAAGPLVLIQMRIDRRRAAFEEQLPDVLSLIAGSLRAGWGIQQSISLVVQEVADPSASEFGRVESETRFGLPFEEALQRMAERVDSDDFRWTVAAVTIQREVGGNLAEVLDIVAYTIRQRAELRRHVSALSAEGRFSAIVLALLPFLVMVGMVLIAPQYVAVLFTARIGLIMLGFGAVLLVVGVIWIIRLTKVEI